MATVNQFDQLYDVYGWREPRYMIGHAMFSSLGADADKCTPCRDQKSASYTLCRNIDPTRPERQKCFEQADSVLDMCLKANGCPAGVSVGTVVAVAAVAMLLLRG